MKNLTQKKKEEGDGLLGKLKAATEANNKLALEHDEERERMLKALNLKDQELESYDGRISELERRLKSLDKYGELIQEYEKVISLKQGWKLVTPGMIEDLQNQLKQSQTAVQNYKTANQKKDEKLVQKHKEFEEVKKELEEFKFRLEETKSDGIRHEDIVAKLMKEINHLKGEIKKQDRAHTESLQI